METVNEMKIHEECAVFGMRGKDHVFDSIYYGLYSLQHRGQESAGIATYTDKINLHKKNGLVVDVFRDVCLEGKVGIGHVRYSTCGESNETNAQPIVMNYSKGSFAIAHNGNLVNSHELRNFLERKGRVFHTTTDTEIIAHLIIKEHLKALNGNGTASFIEAIKAAMNKLKGAYSLAILKDDKIIGVRDPWGFRPLVLGKSKNGYAIASETCAIDAICMETVRDIKPSEIIVIGDSIESYSGRKEQTANCMFEYVYFARPDSVMDGRSIYEVRKQLGRVLARESPANADMVAAVPDSGITAAIGYSEGSGIPYGEALMKNRYLGRTFIMPNQKERELGVKIKLNPIKSQIRDKRIVLVDDSIVRGTTIKKLINLLKLNGAREVHVRITCPPILHPCFYGVDMQTYDQFIACKKSLKEIERSINADSLAYISHEGLVEAIGKEREKLCMACITGDYPIKEEQTKLSIPDLTATGPTEGTD